MKVLLNKCTLKNKHIQENSFYARFFKSLQHDLRGVEFTKKFHMILPTVSIAAASIHCLIPCHSGLLKAYGLIYEVN